MPRLPAFLRWLATSAGISGLLIAFGYLVRFSQESFLGVPVNQETSAAAFLLDGGRFFTDLFVLVPSLFVDNVFSLLLPMACVLTLVIVIWRRRRNRPIRIPTWLYAGLVLLASVGEIVWHDLPTIKVDDLLLKRVAYHGPMDVTPALLKYRTLPLRDAIVCSRIDCSPALEPANGLDPSNPESTPNPDPIRPYISYLHSWFSSGLLWTLGLAIFSAPLFIHFWRPRRDQGAKIETYFASQALTALCLISIFINVFFIPIIYARTVKPTTFSEAELHYATLSLQARAPAAGIASDQGRADPPAGTGNSNAAKIDASPDAACAPTVRVIPGYVLSSGETLTIFNKNDGKVWVIPKTALQTLEIFGKGDVLTGHFLKFKH